MGEYSLLRRNRFNNRRSERDAKSDVRRHPRGASASGTRLTRSAAMTQTGRAETGIARAPNKRRWRAATREASDAFVAPEVSRCASADRQAPSTNPLPGCDSIARRAAG
ncbi:hypothetical protein WS71_01055 [Burkholderia mayonis]|uniref:Uncharacterized protein n=1 Tax=Burkholderia mayonis TaxID=1385591 RepID=A0A1B4FQX3_9BURK|nr:hypothetical protein WS71_01055 [Burkholderia mayonis]KVE56864.1 hypothetical protein WS71_02195 [Burkholderia mayonis]